MDKNTTMVLVAVAVVAVVVMSSRRADAAPQRPMGGRTPLPRSPGDAKVPGTDFSLKDVTESADALGKLWGWFRGDDDYSPSKLSEKERQAEKRATDYDWEGSNRCLETNSSGEYVDNSSDCRQARLEYYGSGRG